MANWSDLHDDLLVLIARRICLIEDFVTFGSVCQSWRWAATKQNFSKLVPIPSLMLVNDDEGSTFREFCNLLSQDNTFKLTLPEANGKTCFFSEGWLFTIGKDLELNLLNPLTRSQIRLPAVTTFPNTHTVIDLQSFFIAKAVLSASPSRTSDYVVMVIHGGPRKLAFYKPGDRSWTIIDTYLGMYMDVIYYKEKFYAVNSEGTVLVCDVSGSNPTTTAEVFSVLPHGYISHIEKLYLVELSGKLLMVSREGVDLRLAEEGSDKETYGTTSFQVFALNESNGSSKWEEIRSIGNVALFLGDNTSFSVNVHFTPCKANCIYFTDDCRECYIHNNIAPNGGGKDSGVYNLLDGSFEPLFKDLSESCLTPPLWVVVSTSFS